MAPFMMLVSRTSTAPDVTHAGHSPGEATGTQNPTGVLAQGGVAFWGSGA